MKAKLVLETLEFERNKDIYKALGMSRLETLINNPTLDEELQIDGSWKITFYDGSSQIFHYYDDDAELDYNGYVEVNGMLIFRNEDNTLAAYFNAFSSTGDPDDPNWEIDDLEKLEIIDKNES